MLSKVKNLVLLTLSVFALFVFISFGQPAYAEETQVSPPVVSMGKVSPYILETTYIATQNDDKMRSSKNNLVTVQFDFSDAEFLDENGKVMDKDKVMKTIIPAGNTRSANTSGGAWQSGSGYSVCKGMSVNAKAAWGAFNAWYKVDFTHVQSGYDHLDRVYGA